MTGRMVTGTSRARAELKNSLALCIPRVQIFASSKRVEKGEVICAVDAAKSANRNKSQKLSH